MQFAPSLREGWLGGPTRVVETGPEPRSSPGVTPLQPPWRPIRTATGAGTSIGLNRTQHPLESSDGGQRKFYATDDGRDGDKMRKGLREELGIKLDAERTPPRKQCSRCFKRTPNRPKPMALTSWSRSSRATGSSPISPSNGILVEHTNWSMR